MMGHQLASVEKRKGISLLKTLAENGSFEMAAEILGKIRRKVGEKRECYLCEGKFKNLPGLVDKAVRELEGYEYTSFLVGIKLPIEVEEKEDEFKAEFEVKHGENMRNEFSREIGKKLAEITGKTTDYKRPDIAVIVNPFTQQVTLQVNPLFIAGRYRKLVRGIPQSKWLCRECRGKGCQKCGWTGKMYPESVEEIIAAPLLEETQGEEAILHATGREDIDARMLGRGRPFVMEVKKPKKRFIDLRALTKTINEKAQGKVKVLGLRFANRDAVEKLKKGEAAEKVYRAIVEFEREISDEEIGVIEKTLTNATINQQTPLRVLHRRADRVREKHIYETKIKRLTPKRIEMRVRCQGGLYIKELITGDEGRTDPSVAKIVGVRAQPLKLDVLDVVMERT
jgi:tRNA pseudouridine synthase 10